MHKLYAKLQLFLNINRFSKKSLKEKYEIISCCKVHKRNRESKNPSGEDRNEESLGIRKKG